MKIQQAAVNVTASGIATPWLLVDWWEHPFDLGVLVTQDNAGGNTLSVDYILGTLHNDSSRPVLASQIGTTITVFDNGPPLPAYAGGGLGTGLAVGDYVQLSSSPGGLLDGGYTVASVVSATEYTLTSSGSQTVAATSCTAVGGQVSTGAASGPVINQAPAATRMTFGVTVPIYAIRARCTTFSAAAVARILTIQGGR